MDIINLDSLEKLILKHNPNFDKNVVEEELLNSRNQNFDNFDAKFFEINSFNKLSKSSNSLSGLDKMIEDLEVAKISLEVISAGAAIIAAGIWISMILPWNWFLAPVALSATAVAAATGAASFSLSLAMDIAKVERSNIISSPFYIFSAINFCLSIETLIFPPTFLLASTIGISGWAVPLLLH